MKFQYESLGCCKRCLLSVKGGVVGGLESFFFAYGKFVVRRPGLVITLSLLLSIACGSGARFIYRENEGVKLWVPDTSSSR
jgi:hypothetical protein